MQPVFPFAFSEKEPTNQAEKETKVRDLGGLSVSLSVAI
jgi:hypothetical protein